MPAASAGLPAAMKKPDDAGLMQALDYILNRASPREIDALEAAVKRRKDELARGTGGFPIDPELAAREMADAARSSIDMTMNAVRETFRGFALGLLDKEAPELSAAEKERLVEAWIPQGGDPFAASLAEDGKVAGIPRGMMQEMALQFVAYGTGTMPSDEAAALRRDVGDWPAAYWRRFPVPVQKLIKAFLSGKCSQSEFEAALSRLLM